MATEETSTTVVATESTKPTAEELAAKSASETIAKLMASLDSKVLQIMATDQSNPLNALVAGQVIGMREQAAKQKAQDGLRSRAGEIMSKAFNASDAAIVALVNDILAQGADSIRLVLTKGEGQNGPSISTKIDFPVKTASKPTIASKPAATAENGAGRGHTLATRGTILTIIDQAKYDKQPADVKVRVAPMLGKAYTSGAAALTAARGIKPKEGENSYRSLEAMGLELQ